MGAERDKKGSRKGIS
ncbi:hypothetical protein E2C01_064258 [Portunus trituberculatus]|uniref:Uncharacterized protein n=1 Tax=Portunus trituberculatus TaxID=210409 RepID=A0A5B7HIK9_PORTR|nr:hypothetical protein [Portunus trituberculatus]